MKEGGGKKGRRVQRRGGSKGKGGRSVKGDGG